MSATNDTPERSPRPNHAPLEAEGHPLNLITNDYRARAVSSRDETAVTRGRLLVDSKLVTPTDRPGVYAVGRIHSDEPEYQYVDVLARTCACSETWAEDRHPCRHVYAVLIYAAWHAPYLDRRPVPERTYRRCRKGDRRAVADERTGLCRDHLAELSSVVAS